MKWNVSVLGQEEGYMVKYTPTPLLKSPLVAAAAAIGGGKNGIKAPWRRWRQWQRGGIFKKCLKAIWQRCYYPHRSRDALSPVCGIFYSPFSFFLRFSCFFNIYPIFPVYSSLFFKFYTRISALIALALFSKGIVKNHHHLRNLYDLCD